MKVKGTKSITFHYLSGAIYLPQRQILKLFIKHLFKKEKIQINHINFIFCSDAYLFKINKEYLHHQTLTDIITFHYHEKGEPVLADIFISTDRLRENAKAYFVSFNQEIHRVIFHGCLHLCGYRDKTTNQIKLIRNKENAYLSAYFVPRETKV